MLTDIEVELRDAYLQGYEDRATYSRKMVVDRYELAEKYAKNQAKNNEVLDLVSESFSPKQSHKVRGLCKDFYLWMQENDYDHNIPQRVESKAELFLREKNVR